VFARTKRIANDFSRVDGPPFSSLSLSVLFFFLVPVNAIS